MSKETKKTAGERIKNLEETLLGSLNALRALNEEQETIKEALRLLGNKIDSVVKLLNAGKELNDLNIASVMVQNKADKMAQDTASAVQQGILVKSDTVDKNSFVIAREVMDDGSVINPRLQFTVEGAQENLKTKVLGAKVADKIMLVEGKANIEVLEIYSITEPAAPQAASDAAETAPQASGSQEAAPAQA